MISLFLGGDSGLVTLFSAANDVVGNIEDLHIHSLYMSAWKLVPSEQRENGFNSGLRMNLSVVLLNCSTSHTSEVSLDPTHLEIAGNSVHEPFIALNHLYGTDDAVLSQQRGSSATSSQIGISESLPMR